MDQDNARPVFLRRGQVEARTGMSTTTLYDRMAKGKFPRPVGLGDGIGKRWIEAEVEQWMGDRIAERDAATTKES
jgi:prophage regulatory protein